MYRDVPALVRDKIVRRMTAKDTYIFIAGQQPTVKLINNGAMTSRQPGAEITRQVLVTPRTHSTPADMIIQQQHVFGATKSSLNSQSSSSAFFDPTAIRC